MRAPCAGGMTDEIAGHRALGAWIDTLHAGHAGCPDDSCACGGAELSVQIIQSILEKHLGKIQTNHSLADLKAECARVFGFMRERNVEVVQQTLQPENTWCYAFVSSFRTSLWRVAVQCNKQRID